MNRYLGDIPYRFLSDVVSYFEQCQRQQIDTNVFNMQYCGNIARMLGHRDIVRRIEACLVNSNMRMTFGSAISNISISKVPDRPHSLGNLERFKQCHPVFSDFEKPTYLPSDTLKALGMENFVTAINYSFFRQAWDIALGLETKHDRERIKEEILGTASILGEFDFVEEMFSELEIFRRSGAITVLILETYARGLYDQAQIHLTVLNQYPENETVNERLHLALGLSGFVPWLGYPWPDY